MLELAGYVGILVVVMSRIPVVCSSMWLKACGATQPCRRCVTAVVRPFVRMLLLRKRQRPLFAASVDAVNVCCSEVRVSEAKVWLQIKSTKPAVPSLMPSLPIQSNPATLPYATEDTTPTSLASAASSVRVFSSQWLRVQHAIR